VSGRSYVLSGVPVFECATDGAPLRTAQDALDLIGQARDADFAIIPVAALDPAFFDLSTRLAGEMLQKFTNYRLRVAIVGDLSAHMARSAPLRDFIAESNRGRAVWFAPDIAEVERRLAAG
jgi:hypothetical protein